MAGKTKRNGARAASRAKPDYPGKPGPKVGRPHSGQITADFEQRWRGGRPNPIKQTVEQCLESKGGPEKAANFLVELVENKKAPIRERRAAATEILDRTSGRPVDRIAVANLDANQPSTGATDMSDDALARIASGALIEDIVLYPDAIDAEVIDIKPIRSNGSGLTVGTEQGIL